jgi:hypothetical protein
MNNVTLQTKQQFLTNRFETEDSLTFGQGVGLSAGFNKVGTWMNRAATRWEIITGDMFGPFNK